MKAGQLVRLLADYWDHDSRTWVRTGRIGAVIESAVATAQVQFDEPAAPPRQIRVFCKHLDVIDDQAEVQP